jgi:hypothetical protein
MDANSLITPECGTVGFCDLAEHSEYSYKGGFLSRQNSFATMALALLGRIDKIWASMKGG